MELKEKGFKILYSRYKNGAKQRDIPFYLDFEFFKNLVTSNCFYCGDKPSQLLRDKDVLLLQYNGLDRLNSDKNYSEGNVIPCCKQCNRAKMADPIDIFDWWCWRMVEHKIKSTFGEEEWEKIRKLDVLDKGSLSVLSSTFVLDQEDREDSDFFKRLGGM
jgi:hypothetical protein